MKRQQGIIEWAMHYYQITLLVLTVLVGLGIYGLVNMPKQEFPEFTIRQGVVVGVYPGATSAEVEEQLAKPLERYLYTFKEIKKKKTYSMSRDGMVYIMVELNDEVNNKDEVWSKIKLGLQNFKSQLPSGVQLVSRQLIPVEIDKTASVVLSLFQICAVTAYKRNKSVSISTGIS